MKACIMIMLICIPSVWLAPQTQASPLIHTLLAMRSPAGSNRSGPSSPTRPESPTRSTGSLSPLTSLSSWPSPHSIKSQPPSPEPVQRTRAACLLTATRPKKAGWFAKVRSAVGPVYRVPDRPVGHSDPGLGGSGKTNKSKQKIVNPAEGSSDRMRYSYHLTEEGTQWLKDPRKPTVRSAESRLRKLQKYINRQQGKGAQQ